MTCREHYSEGLSLSNGPLKLGLTATTSEVSTVLRKAMLTSMVMMKRLSLVSSVGSKSCRASSVVSVSALLRVPSSHLLSSSLSISFWESSLVPRSLCTCLRMIPDAPHTTCPLAVAA